MKVIAQRVKSAKVLKEDEVISEIGEGFVVYVGVERNEEEKAIYWFVDKLKEKLKENEEVLILSQFTLLAQFKNAKPSFHRAEEHFKAKEYFENVVKKTRAELSRRVKSGVFGVYLQILQEFESVNAELWESSNNL
ncbi:D-tyrosyl-tRNA(Tyr) deacylase [Vittaforma corneae ATCC 50505]|uniref:D-aminoacyl-tRNA deacylase n=1 Tax=Vittaforma corneae (strain ATCC 50505) TaxID=993615 RepID=L2GMI8_VITCO|nr:D-tyrosyl-tRNA(Tyr) deacylase [Vittaforma corneae ATCC 50505]ELA42056.1 D-tyrosyl-tRNA(Tyr) deacylase [Vittaforma corneae ATCC 50505]